MSEVTDKMVDAAWDAWDLESDPDKSMRATIEAALVAREPVDEMIPLAELRVDCAMVNPPKPEGLGVIANGKLEELKRAHDQYAALVDRYEQRRGPKPLYDWGPLVFFGVPLMLLTVLLAVFGYVLR